MFGWLFSKNETDSQTLEKEHTEDFSNIEVVAHYFKELSGVTFDKQLSILDSKTKSFCLNNEIYSYNELLTRIEQDKVLKEGLIDRLTTNETFFYREFNQIKELVSLVKQESAPVRILCAPCATGEETYSIAITLLEEGVRPSQFSITGIDINAHAIQRARQAIYRERNVKNLSDDLKSHYFHEEDGMYKLSSTIKDLVEFHCMNIFTQEFKTLGKFDYIFSRNMLIYFDMQTKDRAVKVLESMRRDSSKKIFFGHADLF